MTSSEDLYDVPKGTAYLTSQQFLLYATYFIFYVLLARILNKTEVGQFAVLAGIQAVFTGIISGSFPSAATRFISRSIANHDLRGASGAARVSLRLALAAGGPTLVVALFLSPYLSGYLQGFVDPTNLLLVTFTSAFVGDIMALYTAFFIGVGRYAQTFYQNVLYVPLSRGLGLLLAYLGMRVLGVMVGWAVGGFATVLLSLYLWKGQLPKGGSYPIKPILIFSLPVFATTLVSFGQLWGDIGILYVLFGAIVVGPYYLILSSVSFLSVLWSPVNQAIYPALSAAHSTNNTKAISDKLAAAFRLINLSVLPIGAALAAISPTAIEIIYGPQYVSQDFALSILALSSVWYAQGILLTTVLQAVGHTRQYLIVSIIQTVAFLGIVWVAAIYLGTLAGAIGRVVLYLLDVLLPILALRRTLATHTSSAMKKALPLAAAVALPLLAVDQYFLRIAHPSWLRPSIQLVILLVLSIGLFGFFSRQLRVFHHGDFAMLHNVLPPSLRPILKRFQRVMVGEP